MAASRKCRACGLKLAVIGGTLIDPMRSPTGNVIVVGGRVYYLTEEDLAGPLATRPRFWAHLDWSIECRRIEDPKPKERKTAEKVACPGGMKGKPHMAAAARAIAVRENSTGRRIWVCAKHLPWMQATGWTREESWTIDTR